MRKKMVDYPEAVMLIALNDDHSMDEEYVAGLVTTCLISDLFAITAKELAHDVVKFRRRIQLADARKARDDGERTYFALAGTHE